MRRAIAVLVFGALVVACDGGTPSGTSFQVPMSGADVTSGDGRLDLHFPGGAVSTSTQIDVRPLGADAPPGAIGEAYELTPDGLVFNVPVTLTFRYSGEDLGGRDPSSLRVATYATQTREWVALDGQRVDTEAGTVSGQTSHFSVYGVVPSSDTCVPDTCNPANPSADGTPCNTCTGAAGVPCQSASPTSCTQYWCDGAAWRSGPCVEMDAGAPTDACVPDACNGANPPTPGTPCTVCPGSPAPRCGDASPTSCTEYWCDGTAWQSAPCGTTDAGPGADACVPSSCGFDVPTAGSACVACPGQPAPSCANAGPSSCTMYTCTDGVWVSGPCA